MKEICKNCAHWKNEQAEIGYSIFKGICTSAKWKFTIHNDSAATVLDRSNRSEKGNGEQRFESQSDQIPFGNVERSRYCLVTDTDFGCVHFEKPSTKQLDDAI